MPRIKTFVWKLAHGSHALCPFCSLSEETATHLIWNCPKISHQWHLLLANMGLNPAFLNSLHNGAWLTSSFKVRAEDSWVKALIATLVWLIWKERCNWTVKSSRPNFNSLLPRALITCANFFKASSHKFKEFSYHRINQTSISVYTDGSWNSASKMAGLGFAIITNPGHILLAGSDCSLMDNPIQAAINLALKECISHN